MVVIRALRHEAANLQRQGQLALWLPSFGQEAAQVGSARAARPQDHIFPSYREHVVGTHPRRRPDRHHPSCCAGSRHGGWDPRRERQHPHLHARARVADAARDRATRWASQFDGAIGTGDPEHDEAVIVYFGDGASSQGDVQRGDGLRRELPDAPGVLPAEQPLGDLGAGRDASRARRSTCAATGYGIPSVPIDGNDVLASYAVTRSRLDEARAGEGPRFIEALTYRMGAHTTSDDPTQVPHLRRGRRPGAERDPIARFETYLRSRARRVERVLRRRRGRGRGRRRRRPRRAPTRSAAVAPTRCSTTSTPSRIR